MLVWVTVLLILILMVLAMFGAASIRKQRLQKKIQFEVTNQGNVECRFQILGEDPLGGLSFNFFQNGKQLSEIILADPAAAAAPGRPSPAANQATAQPKAQGAQRVVSIGGALGSLLMSFGAILPSSVGSPISRAGSQLYQGQVKVNQVQQLSRDASQLGSADALTVPVSASQAASESPIVGIAWAETPALKPGESMLFELWIKTNQASSHMIRSFSLKSKPAGYEQSQVLSENGTVQIRGGFWSRRYTPQFLILATALVLLGLVYWFASIGLLY